MYFVTYEAETYDRDLDERYEEERFSKFETLDKAIDFIEHIYSPDSGFRYVNLWKADKISYKVEVNIEIKE